MVLYELASLRAELGLMHIRVRKIQSSVEIQPLSEPEIERLERLIEADTKCLHDKTMECFRQMCEMMRLDPEPPKVDPPTQRE